MLAKAGTTEALKISKVLDSNGNQIPVEDILFYTPKVSEFSIKHTHVTPKTMEAIYNSRDFSTKSVIFYLLEIDGLLNSEDFSKFLQKYKGQTQSFFSVSFSAVIPKTQVKNFVTTVNSKMEKCPEKPRFFIYVKKGEM